MKFPFHVTLLTLLLSLLIITGTAIGFASYWTAGTGFRALSRRVLGRAKRRTDQTVTPLLQDAIEQCELTRDRLESARFSAKENAWLAVDLLHAMKHKRWFTYLG